MIHLEWTEEVLLEHWRAGDRDAGDELLRRCRPMLGAARHYPADVAFVVAESKRLRGSTEEV